MLRALALFSLLSILSATANAAPGDLDTTFGTSGIATVDVVGTAGSIDVVTSLAIQSDGKILAVGLAGDTQWAVVRFNGDGSLDTSFDGDGIALTTFGGATEIPLGVVVQSDGKIVVAGQSNPGGVEQFAIARYNADGSLDTGFDGDGRVTITAGAGNTNANAIALQTDGRILVAGRGRVAGSPVFGLLRFNSDGSLDTTFDGDGMVLTTIGTQAIIEDLVIQPDGKIVVGGTGQLAGANLFLLARYNSDGSLDTSFDTDGLASFDPPGLSDNAHSVALQPDGKIVIVGNNGDDAALVRFNSDGSPDTGFGTGGLVTTPVGAFADNAYEVVVQPDGKILMSGEANTATCADNFIARFGTSGSLDTTFGSSGIILITGLCSEDTGLVLQTDGKIVSGASVKDATNTDFEFALVRLLGDAADLSVTVAFDPAAATAGDHVTFTTTIANAGPQPATSVSVTATLPTGFSAEAAALPAGCTGTGPVTCSLGDIASGASRDLEMTAAVPQTATGQVSASVDVTSVTPDPLTTNNHQTTALTINAAAGATTSSGGCSLVRH